MNAPRLIAIFWVVAVLTYLALRSTTLDFIQSLGCFGMGLGLGVALRKS